ncbi:MAG: glycoside hydrolase family 15 protein [Pyrinomonadaceae bacterium]|nr:glycoside hydrolase family 15 protein [Pyrinomonadaceae bacterium]
MNKVNEKIGRRTFNSFILFFALSCFPSLGLAQTLAPGAPGKDAQWSTAGKQAIGTSASLESKVWFTLEGGAMTEVYYPDVTTANVHKLEFVVVNPKTKKVETETADAIHQVKVMRPDSLTFQQINTAKSGEWKITKTYTTDVERDSVLIDVKFEPKNKSLNLYVYYDPSLGNSGMGDEAYSPAPRIVSLGNSDAKDDGVPVKESLSSTIDFGLGANDGEMNSALMFSSPISEMTNGYYQTSDGIEQLKQYGRIQQPYWRAGKGNVVQIAKINNPRNFTAILSFAKEKYEFGIAFANARDSREKGFAKCQAEYEKGWSNYVKTLPKVEAKYQAQFNMAAMQLKAHEDKTRRGANIASLSVPWGGDKNANENTVGGYHLVWSRDLYQVATAFMALGDVAAANRALDFLFDVQQKPDGSFPQNSYLDGKPFWDSLQLDEVAFPLILAYQLKRFDKPTWENHVKKAADFIIKTGPKTPQERWEEKSGYSPSTIAAEIAGLVCAAEIARKNGDETSANLYLKTADDWAANVEKWTATTNGKYGDGNYYIRLTENGTPDAKEKTVLNNGAGTFIENEIVDAGFLELVRLGIKSPDDPLIVKSLKVIDEQIKVNTPNGEAFYRYNHDGYGEMDDGRRWNFDGKYTGKGRLWALLAGERGQYELAMQKFYLDKINNRIPNDNKDSSKKYPPAKPSIDYLIAAQKRLDSMAKFANEGLMIPEQIWDSPNVPKNIDKQFIPELKFGEGTGSATPLAWSMAQFIRLAVNLQAGRNLDTPDVVYKRYVLGKK